MNEAFVGKVAVVTGAARGIGRAIAEHLYAGGARVFLVDRNADGVAGTVQSMRALDGSNAHSLVADLADPASIKVLAGQIKAFATKIDVLVNNAGIELDLPFEQVNSELFDQVIAINLRAPLLLAQALVPLFPQPAEPSSTSARFTPTMRFPTRFPMHAPKPAWWL